MTNCEKAMLEESVNKICRTCASCASCPFHALEKALCSGNVFREVSEDTYKKAWEIIMQLDKGE